MIRGQGHAWVVLCLMLLGDIEAQIGGAAAFGEFEIASIQ